MTTGRNRSDDRPRGSSEVQGPTFRRILVPLDGSRLAESAIGHAAAVGGSLGAEIRIFRVLETRGPLPDPTLEAVDWRMQRLEAETYLDGIASRLRAHGVNAVAAVAEGRAADEIVRQVREQGVDLVIASAFGEGGVCEFPEGGTVRKVLSLAPSSAMLVLPASEPGGPGDGVPEAAVAYRRILAPVDGSAVAEWALLLAASLARAQGAELILLHVDTGVAPAWGLLPATAEEAELAERLAKLRRRRGRAYLGRMRDRLTSPDLRVRSRLVTAARVEQGILAVAAEEEVDLIAVGAHGSDAAPEACGATTQRLLAASPVPVLALQDRPDHARPDRP